jgi:phosphotransferase system enzyme I (PtsI)
MLQFKRSVFAGFVTDVGGKTSHTAIVARSMDIPAVVGARQASNLIRQDDWVIIDGDAGVVIVDPSPIVLAEYRLPQRQSELERGRLHRLRTPRRSRWMVSAWNSWPTSKCPKMPQRRWKPVRWGWACSAASFCSWVGVTTCPAKKSSTRPIKRAVEGMQGLPVTIRTVDIGADKPLEGMSSSAPRMPF